jgi:hypothetical protein
MPSSVIHVPKELHNFSHPAGNGQCARFNSTFLGMLGTLNDEQKVNWKNYVAPLVHV